MDEMDVDEGGEKKLQERALSVVVEVDEGEECHRALFIEDILFHIFQYFHSAQDLGRCAQVSRLWKQVAYSNSIWDMQCERLWTDKVYVPDQFIAQRKQKDARGAYRDSLADSTRRYITRDEMDKFNWDVRMKASAGIQWIALDPWWGNRPAFQARYNADGSTANSFGGHELRFQGSWRFVDRCAQEYKECDESKGYFLRLHLTGIGREVPTKAIYRYKNWGFIQDSCWSVSTSFRMPPQGEAPDLEDGALEMTVENQWMEALAYNNGLDVEDLYNMSKEELVLLLEHRIAEDSDDEFDGFD